MAAAVKNDFSKGEVWRAIVRMSVPCCGGLERAATQALQNSGKFIPWQVVTITPDGNKL